MTIIIENGTALDNANSYVSIQEYRDYYSDIGVDVSSELDADIEARLKKSFLTHNNIYRGKLRGIKTLRTQSGLFPRDGIYDEDGNSIENNVIHINVKHWQIEAAKILGSEEIEKDLDVSGKIKRVLKKADVLEKEVEYTDQGMIERKVYSKLDNLMRLFINNSRVATLRFA